MGSCNGCRVLRKGCGNTCVLRPCLEWIQSPDSQGHATLFLSKFFGRSDLINFISAAPADHRRTDLFRSLLYEAVGRTLNPINGAVGLMATGNWDLCEAAVRTVLAGGTLTPMVDGILIPEVDESSEVFKAESARWTMTMMMIQNQINGAGTSNAIIAPPNVVIGEGSNRDLSTKPVDDVAADVLMSFRRDGGEDPKMWKLFG